MGGLLAAPVFRDPPRAAHRTSHGPRQHDARRKRRLAMIESGETPIISWDGEGYGSHGHRYVLFAGHDGQGFAELRDERGLPSLRILDLIWRMDRARPGAIHVIYGGGYDFNHWVRWVDEATARVLLRGHPTLIGPFVVRWTGLWFELWRRGHRGRPVRVWDVWRFWNTSFVEALRRMFPNDPDLALIEDMKARRDSFSWDQIEEMSTYNRAELRALVHMVRQLYRDLDTAGIPFPSFLTGAGSLAGALLKKYRVDDFLGDPHFGSEDVYRAVLGAYAAGRVDCWQIGRHQGPVWVHDLRSAYMWAAVELPDLSEGEWLYATEFSDDWNDRMSVWFLRWNWCGGLDGAPHARPPTERYYPFFYRHRDAILFPPNGAGWHWWPEVYAARETGWEFQVVGGWTWRPAHPERRPWSWIPEVYERRRYLRDVLGARGASDMLKHGLAAIYGKHCQARGAVASKPPRFHNLAAAGWITAYCRALVNAAAHQAPEDVIYQMTDSVAATRRLEVVEGADMGQWEVTEYAGGLFAQAGVGSLWCRGCRDHPEGGEHPKYRGFDSGTIDATGITRTWRENRAARWANPYQTWVRRPLNLGSALAQGRFSDWTDWETVPRDLDVYGGGGKRTHQGLLWTDRPEEHLVPLVPTALGYGENGATRASLTNLEDHALATGADLPISEPYQPQWAPEDPYALPEVQGTLRLRRLETEDEDDADLR